MAKDFVTLERLKTTMNYKVTEKQLNKDNDKERFMKNIQPYLVKPDNDNAQPIPTKIKKKWKWTEFDKFALVFFVILLIVIFLKYMYL